MRRAGGHSEAGFGLVEVLVATLVLALAVMGATQAYSSALDRQARDQRETQLLSQLNYHFLRGEVAAGEFDVDGIAEPVSWTVAVSTIDRGSLAGVGVELVKIEAQARWQESGRPRERVLVREDVRASAASR